MTFYKAKKVKATETTIQISAGGRKFEFVLQDHQTVIRRPYEDSVGELMRMAVRDNASYSGGRILEVKDLRHSVSGCFTFELPPGGWAELKPVVDDWVL